MVWCSYLAAFTRIAAINRDGRIRVELKKGWEYAEGVWNSPADFRRLTLPEVGPLYVRRKETQC